MHGLCRLGPGRVPGAWCAPCVPNNRVARCVLCIVVVCAVCRGVWQSSPVMACAEMMGCRQARCSLSALYAISSASSVGVSHLHRQHRQHCETLQLTATTLLLLVASRDAVPVGVLEQWGALETCIEESGSRHVTSMVFSPNPARFVGRCDLPPGASGPRCS